MQPDFRNTNQKTADYRSGNPLRRDRLAQTHTAYHAPRNGTLQRLTPTQAEAEGPIVWVHEMLKSTVLNVRYPCIGARSAFNRNDYRMGFYPAAETDAATRGLAHDLYEFKREYSHQSKDFYSFVAVFDGPVVSTEVEFERLLWNQLQQLHDLDRFFFDWDAAVACDPEDPEFSFSMGGKAYFVIGLHAAASRFARRFPWPAMVFNAHEIFHRARGRGTFPKLQSTVRDRDQQLQGCINPVVQDFGEVSEARQYSGRHVPKNWHCPFRSRDAGQS